MATMDKQLEAYEDFCEEWKPQIKGQNHPTSWEGFQAGWESCLEAMLERLEGSKL